MNILVWWQERAPRERLVLSIAAGIVILLAVYLAMEPILLERNRLRDNLPQLRTDLLWMKQNAAGLKALQSTQGGVDSSASDPVSLSVIQSIVNGLSLQENLEELGPGPGRTMRIQFGQISFSELMRFLYQLKATASVKINSARIERIAEGQGVVQASIIIAD